MFSKMHMNKDLKALKEADLPWLTMHNKRKVERVGVCIYPRYVWENVDALYLSNWVSACGCAVICNVQAQCLFTI